MRAAALSHVAMTARSADNISALMPLLFPDQHVDQGAHMPPQQQAQAAGKVQGADHEQQAAPAGAQHRDGSGEQQGPAHARGVRDLQLRQNGVTDAMPGARDGEEHVGLHDHGEVEDGARGHDGFGEDAAASRARDMSRVIDKMLNLEQRLAVERMIEDTAGHICIQKAQVCRLLLVQ